MLENPQDESVVRWGNEGDSFVVLEVGEARKSLDAVAEKQPEREVYETYPAQTLQTQQLCELCPAA